jgi:alkylhydroperoxidase family enzyme
VLAVPRIPPIDPAAALPKTREILDRLGVPLRIFRLMAQAETNFRPLLGLGTSILSEQTLSAAWRELAILRVARLSGADYEWTQHVPIAEAVGVSAAQIAALEQDDVTAACFGDAERAVLRFTTQVARDVDCDDATFEALAAHLSHREIVELILAIGFYMMLARLMVVAQIEPDAPAGVKVLERAR